MTRNLHYYVMSAMAIGCLAVAARADVISFSGTITQSTQDTANSAVNNLGLNSIMDGDSFTVTLHFAGAIAGPWTYGLTGATFSDAVAGASETAFDFSAPTSLTVWPSGGFDNLSVLLCLTTGSGCAVGNQLDANFQIPAASLNASSLATGLDLPHPLDLLEDDGITDIQGSIDRYSYTGAINAVPEPSAALLCGAVLAVMLWARRGFLKEEKHR